MKRIIALFSLALLLALSFNVFAQVSKEKIRIAVMGFEGKVDEKWLNAIVNKIEAQMASLGRFDVVNRRSIDAVISEKELVDLGVLVDDPTKAQEVGKYLTAQVLVVGSANYITSSYDSKNQQYDVKISIAGKLIDVNTNKIDGFDISTSRTGKGSQDSVIAEVIDSVVEEFIKNIRIKYSLDAKVIKIDGNKAIINLGSQNGVKKGMVFKVYRQEKMVIDNKMYQDEKKIGFIRINQADTEISRGRIIKGRYVMGSEFAKGEMLVKEQPDYRDYSFGIGLTSAMLPVTAEPNYSLTEKDLGNAIFGGMSIIYDSPEKLFGVIFNGGYLDVSPVNGWLIDFIGKLNVGIIPEVLNAYIGGGIGYAQLSQEIPDSSKVFRTLSIISDSEKVKETSAGFLGTFGLKLKAFNIIQPYASVSFSKYLDFDEWGIIRDTRNSSSDSSEKIVIPDEYVKYPLIKLGSLSYQVGIAVFLPTK